MVRGGNLLRIYNSERLELRAQVPSAIVPSLLEAMDRQVGVEAVSYYNNQEIRLELDRMSALVEAGQGGVDAFFRPVSGDLPIWGITLELQVQLPPVENVVMLSPDAIYDQNRIYLVKEGILESTSVTVLGERSEGPDQRWILVDGADVENGARVLTSRLPRAISGLEVDARE